MTKNRFNFDKGRAVLILTALLVMVGTWGVTATGWTRGLNILTFVGVGVILVGTMLARSALPAMVAHLFSIVIGVGWSFWVTSRLLPPSYTWLERWENLSLRLYNWYLTALQGGTSYDNLMFILQMGVIVWGMGYLALWFVLRAGKPWPAIVPGGVVLLINFVYQDHIFFWVVLYMIVGLLLIVQYTLFEQENRWRREGVFFRTDISFDFMRDGLIFSLLVIGFAWLAPPVVDAKSVDFLDEYQGRWRDVQEEWNRLFADLNYQDRAAYDSFGSSLRLGGPRHLSDDPVMDVQVSGVGRYWRAVVYDYYTGDGWLSRDEDKGSFGPDTQMAVPVYDVREPVTQTITLHRDNASVLYAMSNPVAVNRSSRATFNALPPDQIPQSLVPGWTAQGEPWAEEITYLRSNALLGQGESYQAVSLASRATVEQLRDAGTEYPRWVVDRYLNLPPSTTGRTVDLARQVTEPYDNNFDRAQAIERYLRNNLNYNEKINAPPAGVDKVDYILFELKEAYCDYYASSMIVMLRSLGIPARLAAGFAQGRFNAEKGAFEVLNRDAHSWVEVYFPRYGWIEFEPTAAQPNIIRPTANERGSNFASGAFNPPDRPELDNPGGGPENIPIDEEALGGGGFSFALPFLGTRINLPGTVLGGGVFLAGLILILAIIAGVIWRQQTNATLRPESVPVLYRRMIRLAGWMGVSHRVWQTPYEHAAALGRSLPAYAPDINVITDEYVIHAFSNRNGTERVGSRESNRAWARLRSEMLKQVVKRRLPRRLRK